jgi:hypothetical protein
VRHGVLIATSIRHRHIAAARFDCLLIITATLCGSPMLFILARDAPLDELGATSFRDAYLSRNEYV